MKKILLSVLTIGALGALAFGASRAYFSDTETSTGNTFTAGSLDLKVDNTCHYWTDANADTVYEDVGCAWDGTGSPAAQEATWGLTDLLNGVHKFFNFTDVKPGDYGEDTVSLHVENDAWLRLLIDDTLNADVTCTEPEGVAELDPNCDGTGDGTGELQQSLLFSVWLDDGSTDGFQGTGNSGECNNIKEADEEFIITEGPIDLDGETWDLSNYPAYTHLVGGQTACFGIAWKLPSTVGNEVQTDSFVGDITFRVEQYRNNPTPSWSP